MMTVPLAWEKAVRGERGGMGVFVKLGAQVGLLELQRLGETLAASHVKRGAPEVWVWVWGWDMDVEGPAACLSYARPDLEPITEWMDPSRVAAWYVLRNAERLHGGMMVN